LDGESIENILLVINILYNKATKAVALLLFRKVFWNLNFQILVIHPQVFTFAVQNLKVRNAYYSAISS
jgi:hypothetical protein